VGIGATADTTLQVFVDSTNSYHKINSRITIQPIKYCGVSNSDPATVCCSLQRRKQMKKHTLIFLFIIQHAFLSSNGSFYHLKVVLTLLAAQSPQWEWRRGANSPNTPTTPSLMGARYDSAFWMNDTSLVIFGFWMYILHSTDTCGFRRIRNWDRR
jgi:hypothetical protein